jgi:hypothetical protein
VGLQEHENRLIRGRILKLLRSVDFNHISADVLVSTLTGCGHQLTITSLLGILQYLLDKEYVETHEAKVEGLGTMTMARITAKGVDLLEQSVSDPGVAL